MISLITLLAGVVAGYLAQRSRLCFIGGLRNWLLVRDTELLKAAFAFFAAAFLAFPLLGAAGLPVWGIDPTLSAGAGLPAVGLAAGFLLGALATFSGACPLRQHILAAQGSGDARWWLAGFYLGAPIYFLVIRPLLARWL